MQNAKIVYEGHDADLYVYDDKIVISGKKFNKGMGEKTIPIASISAVQIKPSSFVNGYITFNVLGEVATSSTLFGAGVNTRMTENTVVVKHKSDDSIMRKIKDFVEEAKMKASTSVSQTIIQEKSSADELKKYKELLDMGVISQEEFDAKKKQILGL